VIRRNGRSAASIQAAVQRSAMSPDCQRLTSRALHRTRSIIDPRGFVHGVTTSTPPSSAFAPPPGVTVTFRVPPAASVATA
jgi:hypothetical protein